MFTGIVTDDNKYNISEIRAEFSQMSIGTTERGKKDNQIGINDGNYTTYMGVSEGPNQVQHIIPQKTRRYKYVKFPTNYNLLNNTFRSMESRKKVLKLFVPYSHIQKKYWNQGFLKFYTSNNIPNLLIGLPFILYHLLVLTGNYIEFKKGILRELRNILFFQTVVAIGFLHLNMYFRFVGYNPVVYILMGCMYDKYKDKGVFRIYSRLYIAFGVAYAVLYGCFYPPA